MTSLLCWRHSLQMNQEEGIASSKRKRSLIEETSFEALVSPNFDELARRFPDFGRAWNDVKQLQSSLGGPFASHITQDFSIALTKALLHVHWGLSLTHFPHHHLCPPVPNRYFYVKWLQEHVLPSTNRQFVPSRRMSKIGLDIGTGPACIYPLLFCASSKEPDFRIYATDIDAESIELAKQNVQSNRLESQIQVVQVPETDEQQASQVSIAPVHNNTIFSGPLRQSLDCLPEQDRLVLDFCMTNPPFFDDSQSTERVDPRAGDARDRTCMTVSEGSYPGGELAFVIGMIADGLYLWNDHHQQRHGAPLWSSCMCGKKSTFLAVKSILHKVLGPSHVMDTEFGPSHMTRWFVAWTFEQPKIRSTLAANTSWSFTVPLVGSSNSVADFQEEVIRRIVEYLEPKKFEVAPTVLSRCDAIGRRRANFVYRHQDVIVSCDGQEIPASIQAILSRADTKKRCLQLLPSEGTMVMDVVVSSVAVASSERNDSSCQVDVETFCHTLSGKKAIESVKLQMEGEIARTNRRWRRKIQRESAEQHAVQPMDES